MRALDGQTEYECCTEITKLPRDNACAADWKMLLIENQKKCIVFKYFVNKVLKLVIKMHKCENTKITVNQLQRV